MMLNLQFLFITKCLIYTEFLTSSTESSCSSTEVLTFCLDIVKFICKVKTQLEVYIDCIFLIMIKAILSMIETDGKIYLRISYQDLLTNIISRFTYEYHKYLVIKSCNFYNFKLCCNIKSHLSVSMETMLLFFDNLQETTLSHQKNSDFKGN